MLSILILALVGGSFATTNSSQLINLSVLAAGGNETSGMQYGLMFEEINFSGDGGLYAELIRNRAFQGDQYWPQSLIAWHPVNDAALSLRNLSEPLSLALPTSLHVLAPKNASVAAVGFANEGWWGIEIRPQVYSGSFYVRGAFDGVFTASLQSRTSGSVWASTQITGSTKESEWTQFKFELEVEKFATNTNNTFQITFDFYALFK